MSGIGAIEKTVSMKDIDIDSLVMEYDKENGNLLSELTEEPTDDELRKIEMENEDVSWGSKLSSTIGDKFSITEFGKQTYSYIAIKDPGGNKTGYYSCHCNVGGKTRVIYDNNKKPMVDSEGNPIKELVWVTKNGCLSKHYTIGSMENLVKYITTKLKIKEDIQVFHSIPFYLGWKGKLTKAIKLFNDDTVKDIFEIVTGIDTDDFSDIENHVDMYILNCYNGKSSVLFDFIINMSIKDKNNKEHVFKDYFTLSNKRFRLNHTGKLDELTKQALSFNLDIKKEIDVLKNYDIKETNLKDMCIKFPINTRTAINDEWESLPKPDKNLFFALLLISKHLNKQYDVELHSKLIQSVQSSIQAAHAKYEKDLRDKATEVTK